MRGKRSKQYRKLMQQYGLHFGFREPYQVLLDDAILQDAERFKMDFIGGLEKTFHGKIRPMITYCALAALTSALPRDSPILPHARAFERRRCNHTPALPPGECIRAVVDPKDNASNKHRYCVASQDEDLRAALREVPGTPLVYLKRSVMIMEPMAKKTAEMVEGEERGKFRAGLRGAARGEVGKGKRKREEEHDEEKVKKRKKAKGPSGPNPLSVMKKKKATTDATQEVEIELDGTGVKATRPAAEGANGRSAEAGQEGQGDGAKRKRKRRKKVAADGQSGPGNLLLADTA